MNPSKIALMAVSRNGSQLALRLRDSLPEADAFLPERFASSSQERVFAFSEPSRDLTARLFEEYQSLVLFGSVGMVVRLIAPLIQDKRTDPAVVVVDDAGKYAVSLLSGHLGGANELVRRVAGVLGSAPVITTASDVLRLPPVDLLGREFEWRLDGTEDVTRVSAAVVNGEPVAVLQEAGEPDWLPAGSGWPPHFHRVSSPAELASTAWAAALVITDRLLPGGTDLWPPFALYRPRSLAVGIGCHRGTTADEIERAVFQVLGGHGLAMVSVRVLATVEQKRDEAGLQQFAARLGVPLVCYSPDDLDRVAPTTSEVVRRWVGTGGVSEPAALLASGAGALLVPKQKSGGVTVAVARVLFGAGCYRSLHGHPNGCRGERPFAPTGGGIAP